MLNYGQTRSREGVSTAVHGSSFQRRLGTNTYLLMHDPISEKKLRQMSTVEFDTEAWAGTKANI